MEQPPVFNSVVDECRYWMERAKYYHSEWKETKHEFDEYVEESRQLEAEMDSHLQQKERVIRDLVSRVSTLEKDNESFRLKLDSNKIEFANLEKRLESTVIEKESLKSYLRQLEQKNDDLERAHRILSESIAGFEGRLDKAYEKNALLESEVDEKELLQEKLQRLMDETRDLKHELNVKNRYDSSDNNAPSSDLIVDNSTQKSEQTQTVNTSTALNEFLPHSLKNPQNLINGNAMAASSRTTTLNIVADMLRKINLDKTLMCPRCDKFRCICERPLQQENNNSNLSGSSSSVTSTPHSTNSNRKSFDAANNLFGTNIFKRFAQKVSGLPTTDNDTDNAMESKLKAYREQAPAPTSASIQPRK